MDNAPAPMPTTLAALAPTAAPQAPTPAPGMLTLSEWTRRLVAVVSCAVVGLSILMIVGVMCYRVAVDGNAPLTSTITSQLLWIALAGLVSMTAALYGSNNLLAKLVEKIGL